MIKSGAGKTNKQKNLANHSSSRQLSDYDLPIFGAAVHVQAIQSHEFFNLEGLSSTHFSLF